ncbi:MAG: amidophosphoribosyltransferase [Firmicutes bacterium]|nr:amidophosphoribosyltransferase [Bacillota bacterium]
MTGKKVVLMDKLKEECGVFGIYSRDGHDTARLTYYALYALQHRGQESAGIAVNRNGEIIYYKDMGLVPEVFNDTVLNGLKGNSAVGHVRYSTTGASIKENVQPLVIKYISGQMALSHNGNLLNTLQLRKELEEKGAIFHTTCDSEIIASLISMYSIESGTIEEAIEKVMREVKGAYSLAILTGEGLIGIRDPYGIRPLCLGRLQNSHVIASESCALDAVGAEFIRDINPGEVVLIGNNGIESIRMKAPERTGLCIFEYVYFARPDSIIDGASVYRARIEAGKQLAIEHPAEADLVIGAPDSGLTAALGFSIQSGIPYGQGLLKNRYVGRTFIQPAQKQREMGVSIKFNAIKKAVEGKSIVMVDDSIVRGTTTRRIVQMLKNAGAKKVHMRVSSPPVRYPCYLGIDTPSKKQLVASSCSVEEIREMIGADSLGYLSLEGLLKTPVGVKCGLCTGCFNNQYPVEV